MGVALARLPPVTATTAFRQAGLVRVCQDGTTTSSPGMVRETLVIAELRRAANESGLTDAFIVAGHGEFGQNR